MKKTSPFKATGKQHAFAGELYECPACGKLFPDNSIRMHVYHVARSEAWQWMLENNVVTPPIPHLELYRRFTVAVKSPVHRVWKV